MDYGWTVNALNGPEPIWLFIFLRQQLLFY